MKNAHFYLVILSYVIIFASDNIAYTKIAMFVCNWQI